MRCLVATLLLLFLVPVARAEERVSVSIDLLRRPEPVADEPEFDIRRARRERQRVQTQMRQLDRRIRAQRSRNPAPTLDPCCRIPSDRGDTGRHA